MRLRVHLPEGTSVWGSNAPLFRVGRGDTCALRFEGSSAKYASWEHAEFRISEDGAAWVTDLGSGNGTYVDGARITNAAPLHCGSAVQIGSKGPRLEVLELAPPAASRMPAPIPVSTVPARFEPPVPRPAPSLQQRGVVIGLSVALLVIVGFALVRNRNTAIVERPNPKAEGDNDPPEAAPLNPRPIEPPDNAPDTPPVPMQLPDKVAGAKALGIDAYRLLVIEDPETQSSWPLFGAVVVGPRALLTSGDVGIEVAKFLERGWRARAVRDSQDAGVRVDRARVHAAFQDADPEHQLYFDMALISTTEELQDAATLASVAELAGIEQGQPLACVAIDHSGEVIDRFQQLQPDRYPGKVFFVTALSQDAGAPRLLHLRGDFVGKSAGSPIFDDLGHLVALYCEAAQDADEAQSGRAIHYAKLIEPELIERGLTQQDSPIWVAPVIPTQQPAKEEATK